MELDTRELFRCLARDCNYRDEKLCDVSKADCIARDYILLSKLRSSWRFLKLYMYIQIETFTYAITSHKKRRAKYQTEMLSRIAKQQFRYKQCFQRNNTLTADTDDQTFNCDNADGQSQTGNRKKCREVEFERQAVRTKATRSALRLCLDTVDRTFIYTNLIVDLTDIKSWIVFKFR